MLDQPEQVDQTEGIEEIITANQFKRELEGLIKGVLDRYAVMSELYWEFVHDYEDEELRVKCYTSKGNLRYEAIRKEVGFR